MPSDTPVHRLAPRDLSAHQLLTRLETSLAGMEARYNERFDTIDARHSETTTALRDITKTVVETQVAVATIQGERSAEKAGAEGVKPNIRKLATFAAIAASITAALGGAFTVLSRISPWQ